MASSVAPREECARAGLVLRVRAEIGVQLTDSYLMHPLKSVSGILFATDGTYGNCQLCPVERCPNRRAPYDPTLFDRKYRLVD